MGSDVLYGTLWLEDASFVEGYSDLGWRAKPFPETFVHHVTRIDDQTN